MFVQARGARLGVAQSFRMHLTDTFLFMSLRNALCLCCVCACDCHSDARIASSTQTAHATTFAKTHTPMTYYATALVVERSQEMGSNISKILNAFFTSGYDKRVRPNYGGEYACPGQFIAIVAAMSHLYT